MDKINKKADVITKSFLLYLKKNQEENLLEPIIERLLKNVKDEKVHVVSPRDLTKSEKESVLKTVVKLVNNDKVKIDYSVDDSIIDGLKIEYKDKLWDLSLAKQINSLFE